MATDCCDKGTIVDVECRYESGKFHLRTPQCCVPDLFTVRFIAPVDYTAGDTVVIKGKELPVRTQGMVAAAAGIFKAGAVIHCDIDLDRELAFFWQGGGNGTVVNVLPDVSYEEQYAGYHNIDGNRVYVKTLELGRLTSATQAFPHGVQNIKEVIDMRPWFRAPTRPNYDLFDSFGQNTNNYALFRASETGVQTVVTSNWLNGCYLRVTLYYTCTDR